MSRHRVLVVEDDHEIRESLLDILDESCCDAVGASNGAEALALLGQTDPLPCLILLDLMMPVMDGQAFREAQLLDPRIAHIPVVVVSAYRDVQRNASQLKAASYLNKPLKLDELLAAIEHHC